jgi:hypothetical protein
VRAYDISSIVSPGDVADTQAYYAGYSVQQINTTRVCLRYVPSACVEAKGADACVTEAVNALLAEEAAARQPRRSGTNVAAIAAPVAIAGGSWCCVCTFSQTCNTSLQELHSVGPCADSNSSR